MNYDRANLLLLNDTAFRLFEDLGRRAVPELVPELRAFASDAKETLERGPKTDVQSALEAVKVLLDVLDAADVAPVGEALRKAFLPVVNRVHALALSCSEEPLAPGDSAYVDFLEAALAADAELEGSTAIDPTRVADLASQDLPTTYRCVVRLVTERLGRLPPGGDPGFMLEPAEVRRRLEKLRSARVSTTGPTGPSESVARRAIRVHPNDAARRVLAVVRGVYEANGGRRNFGFSGEEADFESTGLDVEARRLGVRVLADAGMVRHFGTRKFMLEQNAVSVMLDDDAVAAALPIPREAQTLSGLVSTVGTNQDDGSPRFVLGKQGVTRILELLRACDAPVGRRSQQPSLFRRACQVLRARDGIDLEELDYTSLEDVCVSPINVELRSSTLAVFVAATWQHLHTRPDAAAVSAEDFASRVNEIASSEGLAYRLSQGKWVSSGASDAEVLRRVLLRGEDDVAGCRQGDQQVEMVVSTIQARLGEPGAVLVDYGAGLGRVLAGLAQAQRFKSATYVAVDEPIPEDVRALAGSTGANAEFVTRAEFLRSPLDADVVMLVNTLHHMPFSEIAAQLDCLLQAVRPGGVLLVHEMGELREPEQLNVPWRAEDLDALFAGPALSVNPRSTISRSGVPLAHVLVEPKDKAAIRTTLEGNVRRVWAQMKSRTIDEISNLYQGRDETQHAVLQQALIVNANLDLNRPGSNFA